MEHRWGHRHEISRAVHLGTRSGLGARGRISNVSISGAFVVSPLPVSLFSYVEVQFTAMVNGKRATMTVDGQVVRKEGAGFGIEWSEFAPEAVRALVTVPPFRLAEPPQPRAEPPQPRAEWEPVVRPPRIIHR
jgi:PilZ domain-containing protein